MELKVVLKPYTTETHAQFFELFPVPLHPQGVDRGCKGLQPQQHTHCLCGGFVFGGES